MLRFSLVWTLGLPALLTVLLFAGDPTNRLPAAPPVTKKLGDVDLKEGYVESGDVRIHYVTAGQGPLVVLIHGFADFWYTWRHQLPEWSRFYQVVAIDLRGYNFSSKPEGVDQYSTEKVMDDLTATLAHFKARRAIIVGHDWGGFLGWEFAIRHPNQVERLIVLNSPHPQAVLREMAARTDTTSLEKSRELLTNDDALLRWTPRRLASWVRDPLARERYMEAFRRSSVEGMLNHYKAHYASTRPSRTGARQADHDELGKVSCPVLMIHGLKDKRTAPESLNENWKWVRNELAVITLPRAGHFVHHDASAFVTRRVLQWLDPPKPDPAPSVAEPKEPARTTRRPKPYSPTRR